LPPETEPGSQCPAADRSQRSCRHSLFSVPRGPPLRHRHSPVG
jgi:hypothetical protein